MKGAEELGGVCPALLETLRFSGCHVLVVIDREGSLEWLYANEPLAEMFGYTLDELTAMSPYDLAMPEQRATLMQMAASFRSGQPMPTSLEFSLRKKDGTPITVEATLSSRRLAEGLATAAVLREIRPQPSHVSLLEADRIGLVGALSAGFAHEINNPLTSVLLNLRSLRKQLVSNLAEPSQKPALRCLDDVAAGAERIASTVRAFQTLATRSETQSIDLAAVVSASLRLATPTLEPRAHVIRQIFPVRCVSGEESRVGQAVLAMLLFSSSGFDAASSATTNRIVVAVEERGTYVVIEVSDNGRELSPEEARHAFDPFFRSPARGAGVGVGLGIARSVAAALGGDVSLAARPGGGAVITMRLPAAT